ncbi:hypothetical protein NDU88_004023 [Pleurodeles waltl]|uniref:Uncharacterized protein n=1 Tax=Pleurodeles waltl TaxID=8319 RepID=A0AAV7UFQ3_PLEWA|nr:hypothetical protein NDU88_004023 [Pleurodeles waltl]
MLHARYGALPGYTLTARRCSPGFGGVLNEHKALLPLRFSVRQLCAHGSSYCLTNALRASHSGAKERPLVDPTCNREANLRSGYFCLLRDRIAREAENQSGKDTITDMEFQTQSLCQYRQK